MVDRSPAFRLAFLLLIYLSIGNPIGRRQVMAKCSNCGSARSVRAGKIRRKAKPERQRWLCKDCGFYFMTRMGIETGVESVLYKDRVSKSDKELKHQNKLLLEEVKALRKLVESSKIAENRWDPIVVSKGKKVSRSVAVTVWSDWHIEEEVKAKEINGLNSYDLGVAKKRSEYLAYRVVKFTNMYRQDTEINELVVILGGDFITGNLHEDNIDCCLLPPVSASIYARELLRNALMHVVSNLPKGMNIRVVCCPGNHARITKEMRHVNEVGNSLEYMLYHYLATDFKDNQNIKFHIAEGTHEYLEIYDLKIRCTHGHQIKYRGGVGGLLIPLRRKVMQWDKTINADLNIFGHFHQEQKHQGIIVNGSMIGFNKYALDLGCEYEQPKQGYFLISEKKREVSIYSPVIF